MKYKKNGFFVAVLLRKTQNQKGCCVILSERSESKDPFSL